MSDFKAPAASPVPPRSGHLPSRETSRQAGSHFLLTSSLPRQNLRREGRSSGMLPALPQARLTWGYPPYLFPHL